MASATTPDRLLEESIRVIEEGGEAAVTLRDVASACGVTTPIIYKAFGSRDGLIVAAQAERFRRVIDSIAAPFVLAVEAATTVDELRDVIDLLLAATQHESRAEFRRVQYSVLGASVSRPALQRAVDDALRSLVDAASGAIEVARDRGLVRADLELPEMVWWWFGQVQGRILIEQSEAPVDGARWDRAARAATFALLFGD